MDNDLSSTKEFSSWHERRINFNDCNEFIPEREKMLSWLIYNFVSFDNFSKPFRESKAPWLSDNTSSFANDPIKDKSWALE